MSGLSFARTPTSKHRKCSEGQTGGTARRHHPRKRFVYGSGQDYPTVGAETIVTDCPVLRSRTGRSAQNREDVFAFECEIKGEKFVEWYF
jgi:hypothetical protein